MIQALGVVLPGSKDPQVRVAWCGERIADLAEGILTRQQASTVLAVIHGWSDVDDGHGKSYVALASMVSDLIRARDEGESWQQKQETTPTGRRAVRAARCPGRCDRGRTLKVVHR